MIWDVLLYLLREWPIAVALVLVYGLGLLSLSPEDARLLFKPNKEGKR